MNKEFTRKINYKKKIFKKLYGLSMFNETLSTYNDNRITYYSGKVRL